MGAGAAERKGARMQDGARMQTPVVEGKATREAIRQLTEAGGREGQMKPPSQDIPSIRRRLRTSISRTLGVLPECDGLQILRLFAFSVVIDEYPLRLLEARPADRGPRLRYIRSSL